MQNVQEDKVPKVYILNKSAHDYSDAERYGDLVFCTEGPLDKDDLQSMWRLMLAHIDESDERDYIMIGSLHSLCAVASAMFAAKHKRINLLVYARDKYEETTLFL